MATIFGSLRSLVLAPSMDDVSFAGRDFPVIPTPRTRQLEAVPQAVVCGFEWGISSSSVTDVEARLRLVDVEQRGFAYEGATMAFTILDSVRGNRTQELLTGSGEPHIFLAYIGIGFAMARLPRILWRKVLPDLASVRYHPVMSWLAVDGYGFDRAYFDTEKWVDQQFVPDSYPWAGDPGYFLRAVDQGIGRALWFIHGGDPAAVVGAVRRFTDSRHPDLWAGVGLAATFAGGADEAGLQVVREAAGCHRSQVSLGAVFALKGRDYSGHLPEHTVMAVQELTQMSVLDALALADRTEPRPTLDSSEPAYELWRQRIRAQCAAVLTSAGK